MFPILIFSVLSCARGFFKSAEVSNVDLLVSDSYLGAESISAKDNTFNSSRGALESPVSGLGGWCCPMAVVLAISSRVVKAVNRHSLWSFSHIGKEVFKLVPPLANGHSGTTVTLKASCSGFFTSPNHVYPCHVCLGSSKAMGAVSCCRSFTDKASAAFYRSRQQMLSPDEFCRATCAHALPYSGVSCATRKPNCCQPSEGFASNLSQFFHGFYMA